MPRGKRSAEEAHQQEKEVPAKGKKQKEKKSETPTAAAAASLSQAVPAAPPTATEEDVLERVRVLDRGVRESRQNINNCVELVEILRQSQYDSGVFRAAKALHRIFQSFKDQVALPLDWRRLYAQTFLFTCNPICPTYQAPATMLILAAALPQGSVHTPEEIFANWLAKHYVAFHEALTELLAHKEPSLQIMALEMLQEQLQLEEDRAYTDGQRNPQKMFPFARVARMVDSLLTVKDWAPKLLEELAKALDFDDIKLATLLALQPHVQRLAAEAEKDVAKKELLEANVLVLLRQIIVRGGKERMEPFKYLHRIDEAGVDSEKKDVHNFTSPKMLRKAATSVWLTYLKSPLSNKSFKESLAITHDHVIPALTDPRVLIDFLRNSYDRGGVVSILALHGLFVLIKDFNLDYPDFYKKLYALFEPSIFFTKYRDRFFRLASLFLSSTHMPAYIVAAFVKRLARLALQGPPHAALVCIPFMYNLIRRHPSCAVLIHRVPTEQPVLNLRTNESNSGTDPFNNGTADFEESKAIDSSLWELELLANHYHPNIARLAKVFEAGHLEKKPFDLEAFVQLSYATEFHSMSSHKKGAFVPLANNFPTNLYPSTDRYKKLGLATDASFAVAPEGKK